MSQSGDVALTLTLSLKVVGLTLLLKGGGGGGVRLLGHFSGKKCVEQTVR